MIVFVDTNTFLHFAALDQIDWHQHLGTNQLVTLVITPVVVAELDRQKYSHPNLKIRDRAARALKKIETWSEQEEVRPNVKLVYRSAHTKLDFSKFKLNPTDNDDQLLAQIIEYKSENSSSAVTLLTADTGPRLKCKVHQIRALTLPEEHRLPPDSDLVANLRKENAELKNRIPVLSLQFNEGTNHATYKLAAEERASTSKVSQKIDELKSNFPAILPPPPRPIQTPTSGTQEQQALMVTMATLAEYFTRPIPDSEYRRYETERKNYFAEYRKYLSDLEKFRNERKRTLKFAVRLHNDGNVPAENVDIHLHFPDGFLLVNEGDLPHAPVEPVAPERPMSSWERNLLNAQRQNPWALGQIPAIHQGNLIASEHQSSGPLIERTNSYDVTYTVTKLKHEYTYGLDPLFVIFPSHLEARSFSVQYQLSADNLPKSTSGELHIVIEEHSSGHA